MGNYCCPVNIFIVQKKAEFLFGVQLLFCSLFLKHGQKYTLYRTAIVKIVLLPDVLFCNVQIINKIGLKFQQNLLKLDTNIVLYQNLVKEAILQI